ncbi:MAG: hypothetical protein SXA11_25790 [Cyanobacteriota bacterium]|nr:hypothetical protein [Cyanobacteriota bacterium]
MLGFAVAPPNLQMVFFRHQAKVLSNRYGFYEVEEKDLELTNNKC